MLDLLLNFSTLYHHAERYLNIALIALAIWMCVNAVFLTFTLTHWLLEGRHSK